MLKRTMTYVDYNGVERTEDFYFNLSRAEVVEMELSLEGGMSEMLKRIVAAKDQPALIKIMKQIVLKAYGVKSDDGRRFIKSEEISTGFSQTEAYVDLYMELAADDKKAADFINAIMPAPSTLASQAPQAPAIAPVEK